MIRAITTKTAELDAVAGDAAGFGALETSRGCLPLEALDVRGRIEGLLAHLTIRQVFRNSLADPIEATYVFPLPDRGAVGSFRMRVAGREIDGVLKERTAARAEYDAAIAEGHRAAIAEEDRSGVFSLRVGNLPAGETAEVELTLVMPLDLVDDEATFRFPLVVAPRYVPGVPLDGPSVGAGTVVDTDEVPDASRVTPPVLLPGFPNPIRLSLEIEIDPAGLEPAEGDWRSGLSSSLHSVLVDENHVRLEPGERLDRDFILRFPVASDSVTSTLQAAAGIDGGPGTFAVTVVPDRADEAETAAPRDIVFLLDRSGSMGGWKMVSARRAIGRMVDMLGDHDRFAVMTFDSIVESLGGGDLAVLEPATNRHRFRTVERLGRIEARGGTELGEALEIAVRQLNIDEAMANGRQRIIVLVTDGQVAGEDMLLKTFARAAGRDCPRVFAVGIDRAVNAGFLRRLAELGGGACELVETEDRLDDAMDGFGRAIAEPRLSGLRLEPVGDGWDTDSLVPSRLPDVFAGRPITILGRHDSSGGDLVVRVHGTDAAGRSWSRQLTARPAAPEVLRSMWGRARVRELEDRYAAGTAVDPAAVQEEIVAASLECNVLSRFTAFVAVDQSETIVSDGPPVEITQPVEFPDGWAQADSAPPMQSGPRTMFFRETPAAFGQAESAGDFEACFEAAPRLSSGDAGAGTGLPPRLIELIEDLVESLDEFESCGDSVAWLKSWLKDLDRLGEQWRMLTGGVSPQLEQLATSGREVRARLRRRKTATAARNELEQLVEAARKVFEALVQKEQARDRFWT